MAAEIFAKLKWHGIDCELVSEFAKELVWEQRHETFKDEIYIFAKQNHRLFRVNGKVNIIITDRPIILSIYYAQKYGNYQDTFKNLVIDEHYKYKNLNIFLNRKKPYNPNGRNQSEIESDIMAKEIKNVLIENDIDHLEFDGTQENVDVIVKSVLKAHRFMFESI